MQETLEARLLRVAAGDRDAKMWLYDTYAGRLFRKLASRYGTHGYNPEDLLHDAFIFYFQHDCRVITAFLERNSGRRITDELVERYLWDLAGGVVANERRARRKDSLRSLEASSLVSEAPGPERAALSRDLLAQLADCIQEHGRRVYLYSCMRYVDGLEPEEIAAATGWSTKATYKLKTKLNETLTRCAERLGLSR
jgi:DNA-directed RNA polymerase specialized sigma24 family protein